MRKTLIRWSTALVLLTALDAAPALAATRVYVRVAPPVEVVPNKLPAESMARPSGPQVP